MVLSGHGLLPTVMSGSEVQQQLGSVLMSEAQITTKGHVGVSGLGSHLKTR